MILLRNQKGVVLLMTYLVIVMLMGLSMAFFIRAIGEGRSSQRQNDSMKAFYNAEKALSYAYLESADKGWTWFTHQWDAEQEKYEPVATPPASLRTSIDTKFISTGADAGCYAANDGSFILKTFPDPKVSNVTVVRAKGISGGVERVLEYRISRTAIYDFAWWTPYDLGLYYVGDSINGGRIHSNGNIYMYDAKRLYGVDSISTGKDKSIYYVSGNYYGPGYYDYYVDGSSNINGEIPLPDLGKRPSDAQRWAGTTDSQAYATQYPWKYESPAGSGKWYWRSYGYDHAGYWPPRDWRDEEFFFSGDSQARYNQSVEGKTLNYYNTWIWPVEKDANGNILFDANGNVLKETPEQIPAELPGAMWDWTKYYYWSNRQLKFTVYDPAAPGGKKYVEDTRWKIVVNPDSTKSVVMTNLQDPEGVTYWNMLQRYDYWKALGYSNEDAQTWSTHINPEVLDGTYGSEVASGQNTMQVDNTNSMKQPTGWNSFLAESGLDDVLLANEKGENMEAPRFATTYKEKSKNAGLYLSKTADEDGDGDEDEVTLNYGNGNQLTYTPHQCGTYDPKDSNAYNNWLACLEQSIDVLVNRLNTDSDGSPLPEAQQAAKKVKFINTYTNKMNVVLELDVGKMQDAQTFPANGIIYSEVPIRLSNAQTLPSSGDPKKHTFNVICEENIYLKGNYNNPAVDTEWMPSAIISKKQITTLSNDFNDPQVSPAFLNYPYYPYIYVIDDGNNLTEADPRTGGGSWVNYGYYDYGDVRRDQAWNLMQAIDSVWKNTFDKNDPTGSQIYTVSSSHPIINGQAWGAMPNRVQNNQTYNCLLASYYNGGNTGIPTGVELERWINNAGSQRTKTMKGAYFQLDYGDEYDLNRFTAHPSDGPLDYFNYATFDYRNALARPFGAYGSTYFVYYGSYNPRSYDSRFRNPLLAQSKPIFFGGGESSWREIPVADF